MDVDLSIVGVDVIILAVAQEGEQKAVDVGMVGTCGWKGTSC